MSFRSVISGLLITTEKPAPFTLKLNTSGAIEYQSNLQWVSSPLFSKVHRYIAFFNELERQFQRRGRLSQGYGRPESHLFNHYFLPVRLQALVDRLVDKFSASGLMQKEFERVKLHVTVMNTLFRKDPADTESPRAGRGQRKTRESFDARGVLKVSYGWWCVYAEIGLLNVDGWTRILKSGWECQLRFCFQDTLRLTEVWPWWGCCRPAAHTDFISIYRPATHPDLIGISRFFSANLEVSRFPDFTCGNPGFLFRFGRLTLLHGPCHQAHQAWAKNKFYDRLNPLHNATRGYPRLTMAPASHA